jgi:hypothetical protein
VAKSKTLVSKVRSGEQSDPGWAFAIRLLSADCAKTHFVALAITIDERAVDGVSTLAKKAYENLIGGSPTIFGIDFRRPRIAEIVGKLLDAISRQFGEDVRSQVEEFGNWYCRHRSDASSLPDSLWSALMTELVSSHPSAVPPDQLSKNGLEIVQTLYRRSLEDTDRINKAVSEGLNQAKITAWDSYLLSHTPDLPTELSDSYAMANHARAFRRFWQMVQLALSKSDFEALKGWLEEQSAVVAPAAMDSIRNAKKN